MQIPIELIAVMFSALIGGQCWIVTQLFALARKVESLSQQVQDIKYNK